MWRAIFDVKQESPSFPFLRSLEWQDWLEMVSSHVAFFIVPPSAPPITWDGFVICRIFHCTVLHFSVKPFWKRKVLTYNRPGINKGVPWWVIILPHISSMLRSKFVFSLTLIATLLSLGSATPECHGGNFKGECFNPAIATCKSGISQGNQGCQKNFGKNVRTWSSFKTAGS